jgi:hypothetical protein
MESVYIPVMSNSCGEDFSMSDRQSLDDNAGSIVDRLFDMPADEADVSEWDAAVSRRLERNIADMMRAALRDEPEKRRA